MGIWREREWERERMDAIRLEMREEMRRVLGSVILERIRWRTSSGRVWSRSEGESCSSSDTPFITSSSGFVISLSLSLQIPHFLCYYLSIPWKDKNNNREKKGPGAVPKCKVKRILKK